MRSKQLQKISTTLWLLLFTTTAVSCGTVEIKDQEWCGDKGVLGAKCFHTLNSSSRTLTKEEWDKLRFGQVCTAAQSFADTKAALEKLCHDSNDCVYLDTFSEFLEKAQNVGSKP